MVLAGIFVFISGRLLVDGRLVVPPLAPPAPATLELVAEASVEPPGVFWLQPTSANAAKMVMADSVIIDFIRSLVCVDVFWLSRVNNARLAARVIWGIYPIAGVFIKEDGLPTINK